MLNKPNLSHTVDLTVSSVIVHIATILPRRAAADDTCVCVSMRDMFDDRRNHDEMP